MQPDHDRPHILVVDDDDALLRIHARALASKGYRVETAPDGAAAARAIDIARTRYYPDIDITAFAGFQALGFRHFITDSAEANGVTPAISLPIFNRGRLKAGLDSRGADYDAAIASYDDGVIKAVQEVADEVAGLKALANEAKDREAAVALAQQTCNLAEAGLRAGLTDHSHVLEAEIGLFIQQQQLLAVQARQLDARITLVQAVGGSADLRSQPAYAEGGQP